MSPSKELVDFLNSGHLYMPGISIDCVIFGFHERQLKVLVLQFKSTDGYALPGGFIRKEEHIDDAARRILEERTGLKEIYLEQFHVFGVSERGRDDTHRKFSRANGIELEADHWLLQRFLSIGYYALVDFSRAMPTPDVFSDTCQWYDLAGLPDLILDHNRIVQQALETLRLMLDNKLVGFNLLPETFTMNELQALYETILGKPLLRANFQRKMLSLEILERLEKKWTGKAHKAPYLYRFQDRH